MANEQLLTFIRQSRQSGISDEQIRQSLLSSGWQAQDIQEAFNSSDSQSSGGMTSLSTPNKKHLKLIITFAVVGVLIGGYFVSAKFLFNTWPFTKKVEAPTKSTQATTILDSNKKDGSGMEQQNQIFEKTDFETKKLGIIPDEYGKIDIGYIPNKFDLPFVSNIVFSSNGKHYAYLVVKDRKNFVVIDGTEGKKYNMSPRYRDYRWSISSLVLSPDGQKTVYIVRQADEEKQKQLESNPQLWNDQKFVSSLLSTEREIVVINGEESKSYNKIGPIVFSPDGKQVVFSGTRDAKTFLVINGREDKSYDAIGEIKFSGDGKTLVFSGANISGGTEIKAFLITNSKETELPSVPEFIAVNQDGSQVAYFVLQDGRYSLFLNGKELRSHNELEEIETPVFSPDGKRMAYAAGLSQGYDNGNYLMIDGIKSKFYSVIGREIVFSPDSKKLAFTAVDVRKERKGFLILDNKEIANYEYIANRTFGPIYDVIFSPSGQKLAYVVAGKDGEFTVVENKVGKKYNRVANIVFSADEKNVGYNTRTERELWWIVDSF